MVKALDVRYNLLELLLVNKLTNLIQYESRDSRFDSYVEFYAPYHAMLNNFIAGTVIIQSSFCFSIFFSSLSNCEKMKGLSQV